MSTTVTLTIGELIEETLDHLYRAVERPYQVTVGATDLGGAGDTTLTINGEDNVFPTTVLEVADELMLVTDKTADATPVFTVARGYAGSNATAGYATGTTMLVNPAWPRHEVDRWIRKFVSTVLNTYLPNVTSAALYRDTDLQYVTMPADTVRIYSVRHLSSVTGRIADIGGWQLEQDLPASIAATGKLLRVPSYIANDDELIVTYQTPYTWTGSGDESDTVDVPLGTEDLPVLWSVAYGQMRREISRAELDKVEEWNQEQAIRAGVNLRLVREAWGEFYRRIDEARKVQDVPRHRPYRKMAKV